MASEKSDYNEYTLKEVAPMGEKIKVIIMQDSTFIVYMDDKNTIQWATNKDYTDFPKGLGEIQSMISGWESVCNMLFSKKIAYEYKCLLAEGYARILDDRDLTLAKTVIDQTYVKIKTQGREVLKQVYILSSFKASIFVILLISFAIIDKNLILNYLSYNGYQILITALFGGIGAFVFSTLRIKDYKPNIFISKNRHRIDGIMRVYYGFISGGIIALAIKANVLLGFIEKGGSTIYLMAFLGIMTGASEIIIPNLIKQSENNLKENQAK